jgi:hypothetical protein
MTGVIPVIPFDGSVDARPQSVTLHGLPFMLTVSFSLPQTTPATVLPGGGVIFGDAGRGYSGPVAGALIIALSDDEVLIAGTGVSVTFAATGVGPPLAGIVSAQQGRFVDGRWVPAVWMNGDQTDQGRRVRLESGEFTIQRVRLYRYH